MLTAIVGIITFLIVYKVCNWHDNQERARERNMDRPLTTYYHIKNGRPVCVIKEKKK